MPVSLAFLVVVLVWSTTPLGIVWSSESISPTLSLLMRMGIAASFGLLLMKSLNIKLNTSRNALRVYLFSSISLSVGMLFCYFAAQYISSGLMALSFGLTPILSGLLAQRWLSENKFTKTKKISLLIALAGLAIVCSENMIINDGAIYGFSFIFIGVVLFSLSSVLVKGVKVDLHPLSTTVGSLLVSLPVYLIAWLVLDGEVNYQEWQMRSVWAVIYMGLFASLLGFLAYFYILQKLEASTVALVTMLTPVVSMSLGIILNNERFSISLLTGGLLIVLGLGLFQFGNRMFSKFNRSKTSSINM